MSKAEQDSTQRSVDKSKKTAQIAGISHGNIDKVRDILFGAHQKEITKKLGKLEDRMTKDLAEIQRVTTKKFDEMESFFKQEVETVLARIKSEASAREEADDDISKELTSSVSSINKKMVKLDEELTDADRKIREQLLDQSKNFRNELDEKFKELNAIQEKYYSLLEDGKTDRLTLANMFREMAVRLQGDDDQDDLSASILESLSDEQSS